MTTHNGVLPETDRGNVALESDAPLRSNRRHPRALATLASTTLWERLSFYGLQVILAYYIYYAAAEGGLGLDPVFALAIVGAYGGVVYLSEPVGAWLADRVLAVRAVAVLGAAVIMSGHLVLAFGHGLGGLLAGLALIALGAGALNPSLKALMGEAYDDRPLQRDAGFSLFYTGVLVGALVGPIITGFLQVDFGFHVAFAAAAVGMFIGLLILVLRWRTLPPAASVVPNPLDARGRIVAIVIVVVAIGLIATLALTSIINVDNLQITVLVVVLVAAVGYFVMIGRSRQTTHVERRGVAAYALVWVVSVLFWALVLQLFTTFAVFADSRVDWTIGSWSLPAAYISTFEVVTGIIIGPLLAVLWQRLGDRQPDGATKLALGLGVMAIAYGLFAVLSAVTGGMISFVPVIVGMMVFGVAEVLFAPVSISAAAELAPRAFAAQTMALQGLSIGAGATLSGFVGMLYDPAEGFGFFLAVAVASLLGGSLLVIARPWLRRNGLK